MYEAFTFKLSQTVLAILQHSLQVFKMTMTKRMELLFIFAVSIISMAAESSVADQGTELKLKFPRNADMERRSDISKSSFGENVFVSVNYKTLDRDKDYRHESRNYNTVLTRFDANNITSNKSCDVVFNSGPTETFYDTMKYSLYNDKIVLAYLSGIYEKVNGTYVVQDFHHNYRIVHTETCKFYEFKVKTNSFKEATGAMIHYSTDIFHHQKDGTFDVYVPGVACNGARCKYTVNDMAEQIGGPVAFLPASYNNSIVRIFPSTISNTNYFAFVSDWTSSNYAVYGSDPSAQFVGSQKLLYIQDGAITELAQFTFDHKTEKLSVENSNGFLSLCRKYKIDGNSEINCMQFGDSLMKFNETTAVSDSEEVLGIGNLATGGIILVKGNCVKCECKGLSFEKWSHNLKALKIYNVENFEYKSLNNVIVNIEQDNELCVSMYERHSDEYNFVKKCFPKDVFTFVCKVF